MIDLLAIAPHPDDAELLCGGTLALAAHQGYRTAILDLSAGELGTKGTPELRRREAEKAADVLGLAARRNLGLPDAHIQNDEASRTRLVDAIRELQPRTVIVPYMEGRHPDHRVASELAYDSCFLAGLENYPASGAAHRPQKVIYMIAYREHAPKPTFVVDTSEMFERKLEAIHCYESQFDGATAMGELFGTGADFYDLLRMQDAHYGSLIRAAYGEPFYTKETLRITDVIELPVHSI